MPAAKFWLFAQDCGWLPLWLATSQNWEKEDRRFITSKMSPVEKTACNLHKRRDFLGKNIPQIRHISREKNRVQIAIFRLKILATSQIWRSPLVEG
jgi:hypothetical protein